MATPLDRLAFVASQRARIGWFFGQKLLAARMSRPVPLPARLRQRLQGRPVADRRRILADLLALFEQDWRNIEAGWYAPPRDGLGSPSAALRRTIDFFADLAAVEARRQGAAKERLIETPPAGTYPPYYLQKFHFQSDGYLSRASAERYDHQVEVLFGGGPEIARGSSTSPAGPAVFCARSRPIGRALMSPALICRLITSRLRNAICGLGRGSGWSRGRPRRCRSPRANSMS